MQSDRKILEKARRYDNIQRQVDISGDFLKYVVKDILKEIQNTIDGQPVDDHRRHDIDKMNDERDDDNQFDLLDSRADDGLSINSQASLPSSSDQGQSKGKEKAEK